MELSVTIKRDKIAARVRSVIVPSTLYRLSHPLKYQPFDTSQAAQETWWVVANPYNIWPATDAGFFLGPAAHGLVDILTNERVATLRNALDALGYELIEEEK